MKKPTPAIFLSILLLAIAGCESSKISDQAYQKKINQWHQKRIESLTQKDSWLTLAGLYWLQPGRNSFGGADNNDIVFPPKKSPGHIGAFILKDSTIRVTINPGVTVKVNNQPIDKRKIKSDANGEPTVLHYGPLSWYVINRGGKLAVRLKDKTSAVLQNFSGIERFPVDKKWRVKATFVPFDSVHTITIPRIVGPSRDIKIPGKLTFQLEGQTFELLPIQSSSSSDTWFIVFGDKTNGEATYGGGRFVYVKKVNGGQTTYIDFNKAYNPPCAFTRFATCPLPPSQNKLAIAIKAGEKVYKKHSS